MIEYCDDHKSVLFMQDVAVHKVPLNTVQTFWCERKAKFTRLDNSKRENRLKYYPRTLSTPVFTLHAQ